MAKEPEVVAYEIADKAGKTVATGEAGSKDVAIPNLTPNTDYAKGDFKGRKIDPAGEWKPSDYIDISAFKTKPIAVTGVSLDNTTLSVETGKTGQLKATITPANATNKNVTWSSENETLATIDSAGKFTTKKAGTVNLVATTQDGSKVAKCALTIKDPVVKVTGVTLDKTTAELEEGATLQLKANVAPANATDKTTTWKSDDTATVTVDSTGKVTGVKAKTEPVNITATTKDGSKTAVCAVTVKAKVEEPSEPETPPAEG